MRRGKISTPKKAGDQSRALESPPDSKHKSPKMKVYALPWCEKFVSARPRLAENPSRPWFRYLCVVGLVCCTFNSFRHAFVRVGNTYATPDFDHARRRLDLDFFVAGFQKCGTTALLYAFKRHPETEIPEKEYCRLMEVDIKSNVAIMLLKTALRRLPDSLNVKKGVKCPAAVRNALGLERLATVAPSTKIIIGIRNPVTYFQSFYNYRITENHNKNLTVTAPKPHQLTNEAWMEVSTDSARFEDYLVQFGKTIITPDWIDYLSNLNGQGKDLRIFPNNFQIFLYTSEQLADDDASRSEIFRKDLQNFLGLKTFIEPFTNENVNNLKLPEHMDICHSKHGKLRKTLIDQAVSTKVWILNEFIKSDDVLVGGSNHFEALLKTWDTDPCENPSAKISDASPPVLTKA